MQKRLLWMLSIFASILVLVVAGVSLSALKENKNIQDNQVHFLPAQSDLARPRTAVTAMPSRALKEVLMAASKREAQARQEKVKLPKLEELPARERPDLIVEDQEIDFSSLEYEVDWLDAGQSQITIAGQPGLLKIYYEESTRPGGHVEKMEVEREVVRQPVRQEVAVGRQKPVVTQPSETLKKEVKVTTPPTSSRKTVNETVTQATKTQSAPSDIQNSFVKAGSNDAAAHNFSLISGLLQVHGQRHYGSFTDNGDGTITVDGQIFAYSAKSSNQVSGYDGASEYLSTKTYSGLPTARGIVAVGSGGFPMGTVLFIEDFGLVVVADRSGMGPDHLDVCFNNGELIHGGLDPGNYFHNVYLISIP